MKVIIEPCEIEGKVKAIESKSHAHRVLICAELCDKETKVVCEEVSDDINATIDCLRKLGADITNVENGFIVKPIDLTNIKDNIEIDCMESGSTLRFLLPVVCSVDTNWEIYMRGRLPRRPLSPLYEELISHGATISEQGIVPLKTSGGIKSGEYVLPANISSQYISGLLFALPL